MASINPLDYQAIRNTISRYCVALDTKNWQVLREVFTEDVDADYPFSGPIKGWQNVANGIQNRCHTSSQYIEMEIDKIQRLTHITSQHALTTQTIEIAADGKTAKATTYFTGIHFGQGKWKGQEVTAWGKYDDVLTLVDGPPELPGSSGIWRISQRTVGFMGRLGEENVMKGESG